VVSATDPRGCYSQFSGPQLISPTKYNTETGGVLSDLKQWKDRAC
jgi:hypothetical protein